MKSFFSGLLGGILLISIALIFVFSMKFHVYNVQIINPKLIDSIDNYNNKIQLIKEMQRDGVLLTPQEYTSNIASYYNTAIAILVFLFILFSIVSYFHLKSSSKEQIQELTLKIFEEKIRDSKEVGQIIMDTFAGKADDKYASLEDVEDLRERLYKYENVLSGSSYDEDNIEDKKITK
jgi:hypothetical protein